MDDEELLEKHGWSLDCESPLEISNDEEESSATGAAAQVVIDELRRESWAEKEEERQNNAKQVVLIDALRYARMADHGVSIDSAGMIERADKKNIEELTDICLYNLKASAKALLIVMGSKEM